MSEQPAGETTNERERLLRELLEDVRFSHRDKESPDYNGCEEAECEWCRQAAIVLVSTPVKARTPDAWCVEYLAIAGLHDHATKWTEPVTWNEAQRQRAFIADDMHPKVVPVYFGTPAAQPSPLVQKIREQQAQAGDEITAIMVSRSSDWDFSQVCPPEEEAAMRKRVARALNRLPYIDPYDDEDWLVDVVMRALWIGSASLSLLRVQPSPPDIAGELTRIHRHLTENATPLDWPEGVKPSDLWDVEPSPTKWWAGDKTGRDPGKELDGLRRAIAELIDEDIETWPSHGNAPLAIAASYALLLRSQPSPDVADEQPYDPYDCSQAVLSDEHPHPERFHPDSDVGPDDDRCPNCGKFHVRPTKQSQ